MNGVRYTGTIDLDGLLAAVEEQLAAPARHSAKGCGRKNWPTGALARRGLLREARGEQQDPQGGKPRGGDRSRGQRGRKIGTLFVVGDSEAVLTHSRPMILDPLYGHPHESKRIEDPNLRETLKELAQLDGAFVVSDEGVVLSAARYIGGLGPPRVAWGLVAATLLPPLYPSRTDAVSVAVSESSTVRMFDDGELVAEIVPELWILGGYGSYLDGSRMALETRRTTP